MRYLLILFIILGLSGCQQKTANFSNSLSVVEENRRVLENEEIEKLRNKEIKDTDAVNDEVNKVNTVVNTVVDNVNNTNLTNVTNTASNDSNTSPTIPETFDLPVKFASQAPNANWDELHKEACEEAAMITAAKYLTGEDLDKQIMEKEIQALAKWETEQGYKIDLTAEEAAQILKDYFGLKAEVTSEVTIERIKKELALGNLVITPHAGRELGNPYYRQPGPIYHFLVIRGWTKSEFISNDVGTKRGDGYKYKYETIINTVHDWNGGGVDLGQVVMIVVSGVD